MQLIMVNIQSFLDGNILHLLSTILRYAFLLVYLFLPFLIPLKPIIRLPEFQLVLLSQSQANPIILIQPLPNALLNPFAVDAAPGHRHDLEILQFGLAVTAIPCAVPYRFEDSLQILP